MPRAIRALLARPGFTAVAVATLALGLGVNAAIFSLIRTVLLRPLPYRDADRLVVVAEASQSRGISYSAAAPAHYRGWRDRATSFEATAPWRFVYFTISGSDETLAPMRVQGLRVAPDFFPLLGIAPALGRGFVAGDDRPGRDNVVLISHGFWRRQFGSDPGIVGRTVTVDGSPCTIAGVLPDSFKFFRVLDRELELWRPFVINPTERAQSMTVYAKLRPGVTVDTAQAELAAIYASLPRDAPADDWTAAVSLLAERFAAQSRSILTVLQWAVALVLCIACANVANLLLAVSAERRKELAVRVALGAGRWHIARTLGAETAWIAGAGALAGLVLAVWIVDLLNGAVSYQDVNRLEPFRVDAWVVALTIGLGTMTAIVFALLPARRASDADVGDELKGSSHGVTQGPAHRRLRGALVAAELALSIVLLTTAFALIESVLTLHALDRGVAADRVMTAQVALNAPRYDDTRALTRFADTTLTRLQASAGVEQASLVNYPPLSVVGTSFPIAIDGRAEPPGTEPLALCWVVAPRYFATVGIPLLTGRDFDQQDTTERLPVAIVSQTLARRFWGRTDVIGQRLTVLFPQSDAFWIPRAPRRPLTIIGVVGDVREDGIPDARGGDPQLYLPYSQNPTRVMTLVARVGGDPYAAAATIREAVRASDPSQPTFDEQTLADVLRETLARPREVAWLVGAFAALALVLAAIGVYGVMAYLTGMRGREIGIRVALGASTRDVVALVVRDAMKLTAIGVTIGLVATPMALKAITSVVFGVTRWSVLTPIGVAALLVLVCATAAAIPAYRAARTGPAGTGS
jgi:putative ABC transport system permease protein